MGNSPTDKSKDFIKSGMTLITRIDSDRLLKKAKEKNNDRKKVDDWKTGFYYIAEKAGVPIK